MSKKRVENPEDAMQEQESSEIEALAEQAAESFADGEQMPPDFAQEDCADSAQLLPDFMQEDSAASEQTPPDPMCEVSPEQDAPTELDIPLGTDILLTDDQFPTDAPDESATEPEEVLPQQEDSLPAEVVPEVTPRRRKPRNPVTVCSQHREQWRRT